MSKWLPYVDMIKQQAALGLSDSAIAKKLADITGLKANKRTICYIRKEHEIKSLYVRDYKGKKPKHNKPVPCVAPVDTRLEGGILITVYPPMWAEGARRQLDAR